RNLCRSHRCEVSEAVLIGRRSGSSQFPLPRALAHLEGPFRDDIDPKEPYDRIVEQAFGLTIPQTLEETCDPTRVALIIYDMQVGIVSQLPDGGTIVQRVAEVRQAARDGGVRVLYTRHMSLPKEVAGMTQLRTAMAWQHVNRVGDVKPAFLRDSPAFQITPELAPASTEVVFDKITMSAFEGTPLNIALRDCGLTAFVIVGIAPQVAI